MGPSCRNRTRKSSSRRRRRRKALFNKHLQSTKNQEKSLSSVSPAAAAAYSPVRHFTDSSSDVDSSNQDVESADVTYECSTPKGEKFRIPELETCPPAPKKRRTTSSCSSKRTPIAFYAPPDIELFFHLALRGIPV